MAIRHLSALLTLLCCDPLWAQVPQGCPVTLSPSTLVRQGSVRITVTSPPPGARAKVQLSGPKSVVSEPLPLKNDTLQFAVPDGLPPGRYDLSLEIGGLNFAACEPLRVVPALNWEPKLFPFSPASTYSTETVRLPDEKGKKHRLKTVRLALRGSGFLTQKPEENQIVLDGETQAVVWEKGQEPQLPDRTQPAPNEIHGVVLSPERIDLYRVPLPSDRVLRVAVRQGDKLTDRQDFVVYRWGSCQVATASAVIALALALIVLALVKVFIRAQPRRSDYNALQVLFLDAETDSYSLSKFQFYGWTAAALFGYSYLVISRIMVQGLSWPDIPNGLPGIIAIGAGTSVGAQVVTNLRGPKGSGSERPSLGDLVTSGGVAAADRVQMLVWTVLGVVIFCVSVLKHEPGAIRDLDPVPAGMLSIMGLSAAGYLGGKFARKPGPVINEISITPTESDAALGAAARLPSAPPDLSQPVAQARAALTSLQNAPPGALVAVRALEQAVRKAAGAKTTADAEALLDEFPKLQGQAEAGAQSAAEVFARAGAASDAPRAAELAQQAAAALQELCAATASVVSSVLASRPKEEKAPRFTRVIELRGRTLSPDALMEIDGEALPFRMLTSAEPGAGKPEVVLREADDPNFARVLRLAVDPWRLEGPDLALYKQWFGVSDTVHPKTFTIINPDGQRSDLGFTVPPAARQSGVKTGQEAERATDGDAGGDR